MKTHSIASIHTTNTISILCTVYTHQPILYPKHCLEKIPGHKDLFSKPKTDSAMTTKNEQGYLGLIKLNLGLNPRGSYGLLCQHKQDLVLIIKLQDLFYTLDLIIAYFVNLIYEVV